MARAEVDLTDAAFKKFRKVKIGNTTINEIMDVYDSSGNKYYEVDYLSQETIYQETTNPLAASEGVRSILKPFVTAEDLSWSRTQLGLICNWIWL